jgi:hypothetical protein
VVDRHDEIADAQAGGGGGGGFDEADDERTLALRVVLSCEPEPPRRLGSERDSILDEINLSEIECVSE